VSLRYLSTAEAAKVVGVSENTMRDWFNDPDGPQTEDVGRNGRPRLRVREDRLHDWMDRRARTRPAAS
jgi:transposase